MLPKINTPVQLDDLYGTLFPTTVAFIGDTYIALVRPLNAMSDYSTKDKLYQLSWPGDNGLLTVPVRVTERPGRDDEHLIWEAAPLAEHKRTQRRAHVRVDVNRPIEVANLAADGVFKRGELLDISESALRFSMQNLEWLQIVDDTKIHVRFSMTPEENFFAYARVLYKRAKLVNGMMYAEVVADFDASREWKSDLRASIFAQQRRLAAARQKREEERLELRDEPNGPTLT